MKGSLVGQGRGGVRGMEGGGNFPEENYVCDNHLMTVLLCWFKCGALE